MGWLWILLFHRWSSANGQWMALECKGKAEGWRLAVAEKKQTKGLSQWLSNITALTLCYCWNLLEIKMNFHRMDFLFSPAPSFCPSLPISIYQFSLFGHLEHVSADRSLQPISQCGLLWIVVMERPGLHRENYDQQSIAIDAHTSHTFNITHACTQGFHHFDVIVTAPVFNQLPRPHTLSSSCLLFFSPDLKAQNKKKKKESYQ